VCTSQSSTLQLQCTWRLRRQASPFQSNSFYNVITFVTATRWNPTLQPVTSKFSPFTSTACTSVSQGPGTFQSAAATNLSVHASLLSQVLNDGLVGNLIKLKYIVLITTFTQHGINRIQHKSSSKEIHVGYWYIHTPNLRRGIRV